MRTVETLAALALAMLLGSAQAAESPAENAPGHGEGAGGRVTDWHDLRAGNQVDNVASLQRGARNYFSYCYGCHSLKYVRYSRLAEDLQIPPQLLEQYLLPVGSKATEYVLSSMPVPDAEAWFGKAPPDLSLMARARGTDYLYQFLKTFYVDPSKTNGVNNLALESTAMPHVLSELEGLKKAVFREVKREGEGGEPLVEREFQRFEPLAAGRMQPAEYDAFVRDTVNFLDYASEPTQVARRALGVWVVLFLLLFTWLAWLLKKEYWKDVR
jgi:ubiquinol-cytochrome c reductase cytochrome c1 subunit